MQLPPGLYDAVISERLRQLLDALADGMLIGEEELGDDAAPELLARALHDRLVHALRALPKDRRLEAQLELANRLLELIAEAVPASGADAGDRLLPPGRRLRSLTARDGVRLGEARAPVRPEIPLTTSQLLVNGRRDLSVGPEIRKELASADRVDLLCSFLKWSGFRVVARELEGFLKRRPGGLRIITTAYMGVTEGRALDELGRLGASIRISYDTGHTRLHAKAWLFHRDSGFSTAFIGSSNLSAAALLDGLEWNVRVARADNPAILEKFAATFEQYWAEPEFVAYDPERDRQSYDEAVRRDTRARTAFLLKLAVNPLPHQREILDNLAAERGHGHSRNLVVAATGTGKTVVAALDYKRLVKDWGAASLLFVAHRNEILEQSRAMFQAVLQDGSFGERLGGGAAPRAGEHVFASIQSLQGERLAALPPDAYDVVIVDEFHHARAPSYERLLQHLRPKVLLGLTATPERADGKSVLAWFDGRIASELRLWKALDQGLLCPFQYFGVSDGTDLSSVRWSGGRYDETELGNLYTADRWWIQRVLKAVHDRVTDIQKMRALGFCVNVAHAKFTAARFSEAGVAAAAVHADTPTAEREAALRRLERGELKAVFSVDIFNEGVDLPNVDTLLLLRPTESATVFLQQLGRGLRRTSDKECLTVLDFIGLAHKRFRFDVRYRAILGGTRREMGRAVERGFPSLPSGCSIQLDELSQQAVLASIRSSLGLGQRALVEELRGIGRDVGLREFLALAELELEDVYAGAGRSWTGLRRAAGLPTAPAGPEEARFESALSRLLHVEDDARLDSWRQFLSSEAPGPAEWSDGHQRQLFAALGNARRDIGELADAWRELWACPAIRRELLELLAVSADLSRSVFLADAPTGLAIHARYGRDELMAALDVRDSKRSAISRPREGVVWLEDRSTDLLFVTLKKTEAEYSPTTLYDDYPISPRQLHWESQSMTSEQSRTGQRYIHHQRQGSRVLLFVRERRKDDRGLTTPYVFLGPARYVRHERERPMRIVWELEHEMPAGFYQEVKVAAG